MLLYPKSFDPIIKTFTLLKFERKALKAKLKYKIIFFDDSILFVSEVSLEYKNLFEYGYHWQRPDTSLIIRRDNAHDYPNLSTSPFHKHIGTETNVLPSEPMTIEKVLAFISTQLT
jgi:hypothetical protein